MRANSQLTEEEIRSLSNRELDRHIQGLHQIIVSTQQSVPPENSMEQRGKLFEELHLAKAIREERSGE